MKINCFQPIWRTLEKNAFVLYKPEQIARIDALGKLTLELIDNKLAYTEIITLLSREGLTPEQASSVYQQLIELMQTKLYPPDVSLPIQAKPQASNTYSHLATFRLLTRLVRIETNSTDIISLAKSIWQGHETSEHDINAGVRTAVRISVQYDNPYTFLYRDGQFKGHASSRADIKSLLVQEAMYGVHELEDWAIVLHASAVNYQGRLLAFVGPSGSGKSTLAATLSAQGAELFADDCVPIRGDNLNAAAVPGAVGLRPGALPALQPWLPEAAAITLSGPDDDRRHYWTPATRSETLQQRLDHIIFCRYNTTATPSLQALGHDDALVRLLASGSGIARLRSDNDFDRLLRWLKNVRFWVMDYDCTEQALTYLNHALAQEL